MLGTFDASFKPKKHYDVVIIGAGAAGITLALDLAAKKRTVFLAEGGGFDFTPESQDIYRGRVEGAKYFALDEARLRYWGGSTNHWAGKCRPLDAWDFQPKAASKLARWPITIDDVAPFTAATRRILKIKPPAKDEYLPDSKSLIHCKFELSAPVRFGADYAPFIKASPYIDAVVNCNFARFDMKGDAISAARFRNYDKRAIAVTGTHYVLATGGIENSRVLLLENARHGDRLGNKTGLVGAFWSDHFLHFVGDLVVFDRKALKPDSKDVDQIWAPSKAFMDRHKILNAGCEMKPAADYGLKTAMKDLMCRAPFLADSVKQLQCFEGLAHLHWEMEPRAANRIVLDSEKDAFGDPRTLLKITKSALDRHTVKTMAMEVARYVAQENIGRVRLYDWILDDSKPWPDTGHIAHFHLMGGTRMADTPAEGVVDKNCKVFGTKNLYVAGSSVFPSGGQTNPTYTIVQLAFRLGAHLDAALTR